jgi:hypothetical protein
MAVQVGASGTTRLGRIFLAGLSSWLLVAAWTGPVAAQVTQCNISVNGEPITTATGGRTIAAQSRVPIDIFLDQPVRILINTNEDAVVETTVGIQFGPFSVPLPAGSPPQQGTYSVRAQEYAVFGAGLYNVVGSLDDCRFSAWINVRGQPALLTVPGAVGLGLVIVGLASGLSGLLAGLRRAQGRGRGTGLGRSMVGGALVGGGALIVAQQAGMTPIDTANLVSWTGGPAAAAGVIHLALGGLIAPQRPVGGQLPPAPSLPRGRGFDGAAAPPAAQPPPSAPQTPPAAQPPQRAAAPVPSDVAAPPPAAAGAGTTQREQRPPRYAVVEIFQGRSEAGIERGASLTPDKPLRAEGWYSVDVSVRSQFSGVPLAGSAPRAVEEVDTAETIRITVLALSEDFEIAEPVRTLKLPPEGDSSPATFDVQPLRPATADAPAIIRFQLLYRLNLIEDVELLAVVAEADAAPDLRRPEALLLRYARVQELAGLDALTEKAMRIHVARRDGSFVFYFVVRPEGQDVIFTGRTSPRLAEGQLEHLLVRVRLALLAIAVTRRDAEGPPLPGASFSSRRDQRQLAEAGEALWTALFRHEVKGALSAIGRWLADRPLDVGSVVQVTVDDAAAQFVFPWNLLYDRVLPDDQLADPELDAFWGMRYVIEQQLPPLKHHAPTVIEEPFRRGSLTTYDGAQLSAALFVGDFAEAAQQAEFFEQAQAEGLLRLSAGKPIDRADDALAELQDGTSSLLCFFTHGHTALRQGHFGAASLLSPTAEGGLSPPGGEERAERWRNTYEEIRSKLAGEGESWIMPKHGLIRLARLYTLDIDQLAGTPVVLLNMCESAQVIPSLSGSFVDYFIDRGARAVIGTETSTTPRFAHHFATRLLRRFLAGEELGPALLETRREYLEQNDAFGLVYSLFGAGTVRVVREAGPGQVT